MKPSISPSLSSRPSDPFVSTVSLPLDATLNLASSRLLRSTRLLQSGSLTDAQVKNLVEVVRAGLEEEACSDLPISILNCVVKVTGSTYIPNESLTVNTKVNLVASCETTSCTEAENVANEVDAQVNAVLDAALAPEGDFLTTLLSKNSDPTLTSVINDVQVQVEIFPVVFATSKEPSSAPSVSSFPSISSSPSLSALPTSSPSLTPSVSFKPSSLPTNSVSSICIAMQRDQ